MKRIAIAFVMGLLLCSLSSCTPEEIIVETSTIITEQTSSQIVSETSSEEAYRMDRTFTVNGQNYQLHYQSTEEGDALSNGSYVYETDEKEEFCFDVDTGKLLNMNLETEEADSTATEISAQEAQTIAKDFIDQQCGSGLFEEDWSNSGTNESTYKFRYIHKHLGYEAESVNLSVSKQGKIQTYKARLDSKGVFLSIKSIDEQKILDLLSGKSEGRNWNISVLKRTGWELVRNEEPALRIVFKINDDPYHVSTTCLVTISKQGDYGVIYLDSVGVS